VYCAELRIAVLHWEVRLVIPCWISHGTCLILDRVAVGECRMADYFSVLARAVVSLETNDATARQELYERARSILVAELRRQNPKISALTITREQAALEAAIRKIEMDLLPDAHNRSIARASDRNEKSELAETMGRMPKALAAMFLSIAYLAAVVGFSGVVYLRGLALVYADIIQYPILLGAMAVLACVLVPLSRTVFRKLRLYSRSAVALAR
jgi:hypothetical protein